MMGIEFTGVTKRFAGTFALRDTSFSVAPGCFFALLGPSGCGKTTVLRLIAGLERPDGGTIRLGGAVVAELGRFVPPEARNLGMVFQSYALWPHMTVRQNVAFGLALRGQTPSQQAVRVDEVLALVGLAGMADRKPHQLSGGQRQRVALARSLAVRPGLILLDEPLANLDANLRQTMLAEFRRIHAEAGTTFVFVTHDQSEAMALADQVAVMDRGGIEQIAPPETIFARPATPMVARFVGAGHTVPVEVLGRNTDGTCALRVQGRSLSAPGDAVAGRGLLCLRARNLTAGAPESEPHLTARMLAQRFDGGDYILTLAVDGMDAVLEAVSAQPVPPDSPLRLGLRGGWVLPWAA